MALLPKIHSQNFSPTRDHLHDAALVLGSLQRAFLPVHPRDWHYGLEVNMRGILTQPLKIHRKTTHASIDLVTHKFRLGNSNWKLDEYGGAELFKNVRDWLKAQHLVVDLEPPEFNGTNFYDRRQASHFGEALWWLDRQFRILKVGTKSGKFAPVLFYPHHFDLSLVWFPYDDDKQLGLGWSTGDETILEPYIYLTAYPEPQGFTDLELPDGADWQKDGFSGAILPYSVLQASKHPDKILQKFAGSLLDEGKKLLS